MIEIVSEFVVKDKARGQFELAFGPGGAWSNLFAKSPGFRGTTLLRDTKDPRRYLTIELWNSETERDQSMKEQQAEFSELENDFEEWTESKTEMGSFSVRAEATVRPRGKAGRRKT
jgi:heme-degrading monooxygenase HmoA